MHTMVIADWFMHKMVIADWFDSHNFHKSNSERLRYTHSYTHQHTHILECVPLQKASPPFALPSIIVRLAFQRCTGTRFKTTTARITKARNLQFPCHVDVDCYLAATSMVMVRAHDITWLARYFHDDDNSIISSQHGGCRSRMNEPSFFTTNAIAATAVAGWQLLFLLPLLYGW